MSRSDSKRKKCIIAAVKLLIAAAVIWWVYDTIVDGWTELTGRDTGQWEWRPGWLVLAGGIYLLGLMPFGLFWRRVLRDLGQDARLGETLRAYYIGHLGKYVPGKAAAVILRTGLIRSHRVDTAVAAVSVFFETLTMMAVGGFVAAAYLALFFRQEILWSCGAAALMVISLTPTIPPVFRRLVRLARVGRSDPATAEKLDNLGYKTLLAGWLFGIIGWVMLGLSYWATLKAMSVEGVDPIRHLPCYMAGVALAVVAGFLLLILPGGVGVREAFLAKVMYYYLDRLGHPGANATAWASAFVLRLVWTLSELVISGIMYAVGTRKPTPEGPAEEPS